MAAVPIAAIATIATYICASTIAPCASTATRRPTIFITPLDWSLIDYTSVDEVCHDQRNQASKHLDCGHSIHMHSYSSLLMPGSAG
ncbi:MAG: hypothetical protein FWD57_13390, partial [Polyangiaceae bacterium]|nr:hypothetical protein [Polyangiaceae bacterium]